uniref:Uncharacterized protein n=1 Tax=Auxenochlorella protothecoides TaxID=3075 RepID=A0A1D1ZQT4_AUXPR
MGVFDGLFKGSRPGAGTPRRGTQMTRQPSSPGAPDARPQRTPEQTLIDAAAWSLPDWTGRGAQRAQRAEQEAMDAALALELARSESLHRPARGVVPPASSGGPPTPAPVAATEAPALHGVASDQDEGLAMALAESVKLAEARSAEADDTARSFQNAVAMAMAASLSSATYDDLLRDVSCWVRDLRGSCGDVEAALREVAASRAEVDGQLAALGGAGDEEALPRALWLSEQYAAVEGRLAELQHRVAPIQEAVAGLATLHEYIQEAQPAASEAELQRDYIIAHLFEALSQQGLDANHPLGAWGNGERDGSQASGHGGDLRDIVQQLIEDCRRMPPLPRFVMAEEEEEAGTSQALREQRIESNEDSNDAGSIEAMPSAPVLLEEEGPSHRPAVPSLNLPPSREEEELPAAVPEPATVAAPVSAPASDPDAGLPSDLALHAAPASEPAPVLAPDVSAASLASSASSSSPAIPPADDPAPGVAPPSHSADHAGSGPPTRRATASRAQDEEPPLAPTPPTPGGGRSSPDKGARAGRALRSPSPLPTPTHHTPRDGLRPSPRDAIVRLPPLVALRHDLQRSAALAGRGVPLPSPRGGGGRAAAGHVPSPTAGGAYPTVRHGGRAAVAAPRETRGLAGDSVKEDEYGDVSARVGGESGVSPDEGPADLPLPMLETLARRIADARPASLAEVCALVADVELAAGVPAAALGRAGSAAVQGGALSWPRERWSAAAAAARLAVELAASAAALAAWSLPASPDLAAEGRRLTAAVEDAAALAGRCAYAHDALRQRLARAGLPWDAAALEGVRWAAQAAARALAAAAVDAERAVQRRASCTAAQALEPLVEGVEAVFRVHQFAGGLNRAATEAATELMRRTVHCARMADPLWLRDAKFA